MPPPPPPRPPPSACFYAPKLKTGCVCRLSVGCGWLDRSCRRRASSFSYGLLFEPNTAAAADLVDPLFWRKQSLSNSIWIVPRRLFRVFRTRVCSVAVAFSSDPITIILVVRIHARTHARTNAGTHARTDSARSRSLCLSGGRLQRDWRSVAAVTA